MVMKLVRLVIESGTLTATVAVVGVVLFAALPGTVYYEFPALILAKLYANTLVTSLNNRAFLHKLRTNVHTLSDSDTVTSHSRMFNGGVASTPGHSHSRNMVRVDVLKETRVVSDYELGEFPQVGAIPSFAHSSVDRAVGHRRAETTPWFEAQGTFVNSDLCV